MAASLARDMLTMSVAWPSGKRTRYMPAHFGIWLDGGEQTAGDEAQLAILPFQIPPAVNAAQTPIAHCFSSCFRLARKLEWQPRVQNALCGFTTGTVSFIRQRGFRQ